MIFSSPKRKLKASSTYHIIFFMLWKVTHCIQRISVSRITRFRAPTEAVNAAVRALEFVEGLVARDTKLEALLSSEDRTVDGVYRPDPRRPAARESVRDEPVRAAAAPGEPFGQQGARGGGAGRGALQGVTRRCIGCRRIYNGYSFARNEVFSGYVYKKVPEIQQLQQQQQHRKGGVKQKRQRRGKES
ncbi:hypothetical protein EVG20_g7827 [Dentipellis fragilis]|uniref:Uncharacterized protein n=1 Tax=Dentipellis fragilis TaxID=205917 RepID=A0A4Y9YD11_9AGAM|nr:hypothetical protein EVG20_g7827 [Dentipellis fragilis]